MPTILVTGSTGNIGSPTVETLASKPGVKVRVGIHERPAGSLPDNVEAVELDMDEPKTVIAAATGVDAAFLITPSVPNQIELAARAVDALKDAGVPRLVRLSAIGADWQDAALFMREHTETENEIVASGIPYTFLRPNSYMTNFLTFYRPDPEGNIRLPLADAGVSYIDPRDVAAVAAHVLTTEGQVGKSYTLTGPEAVTVDEIAAAMSEATGRSISYVDVPEAGILPDSTEMHGHEGMLQFTTNQAEAFEALTIEPEEFIDAGDRVVVPVRLGGRARHTGLEIEFRFVHVLTVRQRKLVRMDVYATKTEALEVVGITE